MLFFATTLIFQEAWWGSRWELAGGVDFAGLYASQKSTNWFSLSLSVYVLCLIDSIHMYVQTEVERFISAVIAGEFKFLRHLVSSVGLCFLVSYLEYYIPQTLKSSTQGFDAFY